MRVPASVGSPVQGIRNRPGRGGRDHSLDAARFEPPTQAVHVISLIGDQTLGWRDGGDERQAMLMSAMVPGVSANATGRPR